MELAKDLLKASRTMAKQIKQIEETHGVKITNVYFERTAERPGAEDPGIKVTPVFTLTTP